MADRRNDFRTGIAGLSLLPPKVRGSSFYYARISVAGERIEASTKETDRKRALERAIEIRARLIEAKRTDRQPDMSLHELFSRYQASKHLKQAETDRYERLLAEFGNETIAWLTNGRMSEIAKLFYPDPDQRASRNRNVLTPLAALRNFAAGEGFCEFQRIRRERVIDRTFPTPDSEEIARLLAAADNRLRFLLVWILASGMRIGHALKLDWKALDLKNRTYRYFDSKANRWIIQPIHEDVWPYLLAVPPGERNGPLFAWRTRWGVYPQLRRIEKATGVRFRPHDARRLFARTLAAAGVPLGTTREAGGWSDLRSVQRYLGSDVDRVRSAIANVHLPGVPAGKGAEKSRNSKR